MVYQVLARKWRPCTFQEVVGQDHVVRTLMNALSEHYLHHAYLFTGTRGVGKTTIARLLAKSLNCEQGITSNPCNACSHCLQVNEGRFPDLYEIDAASRTKLEDTRELLDHVDYSPIEGRFSIYLIDEVHMLSGHSFNALLKTLEEPPEHVKFLLATTDPKKLPATILSRCLHFHLLALPMNQLIAHSELILEKESIAYEITALQLLARAAQGSVRDLLSILDQSIAYGQGKVLEKDVRVMLGTIDAHVLFDILRALQQRDGGRLFECFNRLADLGVTFSVALFDLLTLLHDIALYQAVPDVQHNHQHDDVVRDLAYILNPEDVQLFQQIGVMGQRDLPYAPTPRIGFEMTLLRMLAFYPEQVSGGDTDTDVALHTNQEAKCVQTKKIYIDHNNNSNQESLIKIGEITCVWHELVAELKLTGVVLALAQQCCFRKWEEGFFYLLLSPKQKPLRQVTYMKRLEEALNQYFDVKLKLIIDVSDHNRLTPAAMTQQKAYDLKREAKVAFENDPTAKKLVQAFNATVISDSVILNTVDEKAGL